MMRTAIRLLTMLCLLWCALGVAEPAAAHDDVAAQRLTADSAHSGASDDNPSAPEPAGHRHCPVAPDQPQVAIATPLPPPKSLTFVPRSVPLTSLAHAPPLQPPAA